jgi:hypothetical protein
VLLSDHQGINIELFKHIDHHVIDPKNKRFEWMGCDSPKKAVRVEQVDQNKRSENSGDNCQDQQTIRDQAIRSLKSVPFSRASENPDKNILKDSQGTEKGTVKPTKDKACQKEK